MTGYAYLARLEIYAFGRVDQAILQMGRAETLDPGNVQVAAELANYWELIGDTQAADRWMARALSIAPDSDFAINTDLAIRLGRGRFEDALPLAESLLVRWPTSTPSLEILNAASLRDGDARAALVRYGNAYSHFLSDTELDFDRHSVDNAIRLAYFMILAGEDERGHRLLDSAEKFCDSLTIMGWGGSQYHYAWIAMLRGQKQVALAELRRAATTGVRRNWKEIFFYDPILEPLRDEPEFTEILAVVEADMAAQLRNVRAMEARGELKRFPD